MSPSSNALHLAGSWTLATGFLGLCHYANLRRLRGPRPSLDDGNRLVLLWVALWRGAFKIVLGIGIVLVPVCLAIAGISAL